MTDGEGAKATGLEFVSEEEVRGLYHDAEKIVADFGLKISPGALVAMSRAAWPVGEGDETWRVRAGRLMRWRALDIVRTERTIPVPPAAFSTLEAPLPISYEPLAGVSSQHLVEEAVGRAYAQKDLTVARVVTAWLDLAGVLGEAPSLRVVAEHVNMSHTGVKKALDRFRETIRAISVEQKVKGYHSRAGTSLDD